VDRQRIQRLNLAREGGTPDRRFTSNNPSRILRQGARAKSSKRRNDPSFRFWLSWKKVQQFTNLSFNGGGPKSRIKAAAKLGFEEIPQASDMRNSYLYRKRSPNTTFKCLDEKCGFETRIMTAQKLSSEVHNVAKNRHEAMSPTFEYDPRRVVHDHEEIWPQHAQPKSARVRCRHVSASHPIVDLQERGAGRPGSSESVVVRQAH
jgi:hypothetical protein